MGTRAVTTQVKLPSYIAILRQSLQPPALMNAGGRGSTTRSSNYGAIIRPATNLYVPASKNNRPRICTVLPLVIAVMPQSSDPAC